MVSNGIPYPIKFNLPLSSYLLPTLPAIALFQRSLRLCVPGASGYAIWHRLRYRCLSSYRVVYYFRYMFVLDVLAFLHHSRSRRYLVSTYIAAFVAVKFIYRMTYI